jgi:uncharacterized protein (DUF2141 family)
MDGPIYQLLSLQAGAGSKIMNESIDWKSAVPFTVKDPEKGILMRIRCVLLFAVLVFASHPEAALAQSSSCPGIHVKVLNIRNSTGTVACPLFESPDGFPIEFLRYATNIMVIKIRDTQACWDFLAIQPGTYALVVIHDENRNGKLGTDWMGVPAEGYGFSSDAKALLGPPSFSQASFLYDGQDMEVTISLHYWAFVVQILKISTLERKKWRGRKGSLTNAVQYRYPLLGALGWCRHRLLPSLHVIMGIGFHRWVTGPPRETFFHFCNMGRFWKCSVFIWVKKEETIWNLFGLSWLA